jgi:hypothetical protein
MERKEGYYWVKYNIDWEIGHWNTTIDKWTLTDVYDTFGEEEMDEINENRILSPDEKPQAILTSVELVGVKCAHQYYVYDIGGGVKRCGYCGEYIL